jgi:hypothetical protein
VYIHQDAHRVTRWVVVAVRMIDLAWVSRRHPCQPQYEYRSWVR